MLTVAMATNDTMENVTTDPNIVDHSMNNSEPEPDPSTKIAVVVMLSVFSAVGVIGNAIAFYIFFGRRSTSTSVIFILALAATDFFTCLVTIPYTIVFELLGYYLMHDLACKTYMFLITSTVPFSAYIMVGIALDRYFCICHPFLFVFTLARAKAIIFCMGIPAVVFGLITALSYGAYMDYEDSDSNSTESSSTDTFLHPNTTPQTGYDDASPYLPTTDMTTTVNTTGLFDNGICLAVNDVFSPQFLELYKKIHAANFLVAYLSVAVLYILIYKSIFTRRANKARKRKENNVYAAGAGGTFNQQEETQMTVINGGDCSSPKAGNKQRKDAKCARKITSAARNEPSNYNNAESQRVSGNASTDEKEEERVNLLDDNPDVWSNETNGNSSNVSTCNTTSTPGGMLTEHEDGDVEEAYSVYIGPQTYANKFSPNQNLKCSNEKNKDDIGTETGTADKRVSNNSFGQLGQNMANNGSGEKKEETTGEVMSPAGSAPEEKPLLSRSQVCPATPPNSLALKPNMSKLISSTTEDKQMTAAECKRQQAAKHAQPDTQSNSVKSKRHAIVRDRNIMANVKTAFMLFIVTLVFLIAFLPALLMANELISLNLIVFYGYFIYNVANPFIYAFMNQTFREDLKKLVNICRRRTS